MSKTFIRFSSESKSRKEGFSRNVIIMKAQLGKLPATEFWQSTMTPRNQPLLDANKVELFKTAHQYIGNKHRSGKEAIN